MWANRQLLNTDNWTEASSELLASPQIRDRTAVFLVDELYANVDVEAQVAHGAAAARAGSRRPRGRRAAPAGRGRRADECSRAARAQQARGRTPTAKRIELLLKVLEGGGDIVSTTGGVVVLDLHALLDGRRRRASASARAWAPRCRRTRVR